VATDMVLDYEGEEWIGLEATRVKTTASDFIMDCPTRHEGKPGLRRALVHDQSGGLTINYGNDYPGGVTLNDAQVQLKVHLHIGRVPALPRHAVVGELYAVNCMPMEAELRESALTSIAQAMSGEGRAKTPLNRVLAMARDTIASSQPDISLWLCIGTDSLGLARWQRIALTDVVVGTL